ncbi:MAG: Mrp/NBP35 family ATP-binding protein [Deltaproteobacteria bacterium]|nr:Mrp/NBP35 family ATP-binding protein [Deltaproteobacteria bacterium]
MASLEQQFEKAFTEIIIEGTEQHLLEAEAVTECVVNGDSVTVTLALPPDPTVRKRVSRQLEQRLTEIPGIAKVSVRMAGDQPAAAPGPQGGHTHGAPQGGQPRAPQRPERQAYLQDYSAVIAVASGKGGVGKSTVAVNLAVNLAQMGHKVSLFDADIYGPSVPIMMGMRNAKPLFASDNGIKPLEKYGLNLLSIGNLVEEAAATIWRGPIVHQVIDQLLRDTRWPGGDFMIIDMPPGTGDVQLSLSQLLELAGAVIVSTPQDVALLDAVKAITMFGKVEVPVLGMVENMSAFICPSCSTETAIFDKGNAERASGQNNIPFLGRVPIEMLVREGGDSGKPVSVSHPDSLSAKAFRLIAENLVKRLEA